MDIRIDRSIRAMEQVNNEKNNALWLYIDKESGCIQATKEKNHSSPMYEIADWVQYLTNHPRSRHPASELKKLHHTFQKIWERYIAELTVPK